MRGFLLLVLVVGCAEQNTEPTEASARFAGEWMIEQPFHALYEASWYKFHGDGQLEHLRDCSLGGPIPTGFVNEASDAVRCHFADRWSSGDGTTLAIEGVCTDGLDRQIVLGFPGDPTGNDSGQTAIAVLSVGGEDNWGHAPFDWRWQKCGDTNCMPAPTTCP